MVIFRGDGIADFNDFSGRNHIVLGQPTWK